MKTEIWKLEEPVEGGEETTEEESEEDTGGEL